MQRNTLKIRYSQLVILIAGLLFISFLPSFSARAATRQSAASATNSTGTSTIGNQSAPIYQGSRTLPEIALTFDDGPHPANTPQILSILQRYNVQASFFCIGSQVQIYPQIVQQELAAGHTVGNHTWDHADLTKLPSAKQHAEITNTSTALMQATGVAPTLLRPPYGAVNASVTAQATSAQMSTIQWNIDTLDWHRPGTEAIVKSALRNATNGSIILMHDGGGNREQTIAALPTIITTLQERGFRLVTVSQLLHDM